MRQECRLALIHHILHVFTTKREFAGGTHYDAHVGDMEVVEERFWKRRYIATRAADVLIISHLLLKKRYIVFTVFHKLWPYVCGEGNKKKQ